jgi:hypothetical protein
MRSILVTALLAACVPPTTNAPPPPYGYGQQPQAQTQSWSCTQIFQCFATCNGDQTCAQGCLANGDATSQGAAMASLSCVAECNASTDENCVANQCASQIETCRATGPDYLIMTFDTQSTNDCHDKSVAQGFTVRYLIDWKENYMDPEGPLQLLLREQNCTRGGSMYCDDPMRRR